MKLKRLLCLSVAISALFTGVAAASQTIIIDIPPEGLTIDKPGTYFFAGDMAWTGQAGALAAITIAAPDVVLDLGGHSLSAPRNVPSSGAIGILALEADRLSLKEGTIKGFRLAGVALANAAGATLSGIAISGVGNGVPGYTPTGLFAVKCRDLTLNRLVVQNVNGSWFESGSHGQIVAGVSLIDCANVHLDGRVSGINGYAGVVSGVFGLACEGVSLQNMQVGEVNGSAIAVSGVSFGLSKNIIIDKGLVSNLHNDAGVCSGIATDDCQQVKVQDTTVERLSTGLMPNQNAVGHTCIGMVFAPIRVVEGISEIKVLNPGSLYSQILLPGVKIGPPQIVGGTQAVGFPIIDAHGELERVLILNPGSGYYQAPTVEIIPNPLWPAGTGATATAVASPIEEGSASDILVENCRISDITGSCDDAHGISLFVVSEATVRGVTVENVTDGRGGRGAKATGIEVYGLVNNFYSDILVENCKVRNIWAISPGDLQAAGYSVAGKGVTFSNCEAGNVTVTGPNPVDPTSPGYGIGFGWAPDIRPEYTYPALEARIVNCTASDCQVGFDTFYFQDSIWSGIKSVKNDIAVKEESTDAVRVLYCDKCSECPGSPQKSPEDWFQEVSVKNIATGNTIEMERPRSR